MQPDSEPCARAPDDAGDPPSRRGIVVGAAIVAALAGAGITAAVDYPWHVGDFRRTRPAAAPRAVALAAAVPARLAPVGTIALLPPPLAARAQRSGPRTKKAIRPPPIQAAAASAPSPRPMPAPSVDARYERAVKAECALGIEGLLCREAVKWRFCKGRWNDGDPGATRCRIEKAGNAFPLAG